MPCLNWLGGTRFGRDVKSSLACNYAAGEHGGSTLHAAGLCAESSRARGQDAQDTGATELRGGEIAGAAQVGE
jgi:hypothetical protein